MLKPFSFWTFGKEHYTDGFFIPGDVLSPSAKILAAKEAEEENLPPIELRYIIYAETPEEAHAIHTLRQFGTPYNPIGSAATCPYCGNFYFPQGSGDCFCGYDNDKWWKKIK